MEYRPSPRIKFAYEKEPECEVTTLEGFYELYTSKYGRGYIEDAGGMSKVMIPRIGRIRKHLEKNHAPRLVDIGTAYGTFLDFLPASWPAIGYEPIEEIAAYAREYLFRNVFSGTAEGFVVTESADIVTMWNVIEHLEDPQVAISHIHNNLSPRGLLCICTPNSDGGYFRAHRDEYEAGDDPTHRWIFNPVSLSLFLRDNGFEVVETVITGHHPERWGGTEEDSLIYGLGDTFEIYARRVR